MLTYCVIKELLVENDYVYLWLLWVLFWVSIIVDIILLPLEFIAIVLARIIN